MKKVKILKQTAAALMIAAIAFTGCKKDDYRVAVYGVGLNKTALYLSVGGSERLTATVNSSDPEYKAITWSSSDDAVATVDQNGKVTAVNDGTATITVATNDGDRTATCTVTVQAIRTMTMTTTKSTHFMSLLGTGEAVIDWGDGSMPDTVTLRTTDPVQSSHKFSDTTPHTITIAGQNITHLDCRSWQLTALDVSDNTALTWLKCGENRLASLDLTKNTALELLDCSLNWLTAIDVSGCTELTDLECRFNKLSEAGLNALFGTLHANNIGDKTIFVFGNPGTDGCDRTIATAKGWSVLN